MVQTNIHLFISTHPKEKKITFYSNNQVGKKHIIYTKLIIFSNESKYVRGTSQDYNSNRRFPLTINHDIYPIGVCLYQMLTNKMPFGQSEEQVKETYQNGGKSVKFPKKIVQKEEMKDLIELTRHILEYDEEKRMTFDQFFAHDLIKELLHLE